MKCLNCGTNVEFNKGYPNSKSCWTCGCKTIMFNEDFPSYWVDGTY